MKSESGLGDWLFISGMIALVGGYLAYENIDRINGWLASAQAAQTTMQVSDSGSLATWATDHWGAVLLVVGALLFIGRVLASRKVSVADEGINYTSPSWIDVKVIE